MLKFEIDSKDLKTIFEKVKPVIIKKSSFYILETIRLEVTDAGVLKARVTDLDQQLEVRNERVYNTSPGFVNIHYDDMKMIVGLSGDLTIEESNEGMIVNAGRKTIIVPKCDWKDDDPDPMPVIEGKGKEKRLLVMSESWLLETVTKLSPFVGDFGQTKTYHFNAKGVRVEALNGFCIGSRTLYNDEVDTTAFTENVMLDACCFPVFKKILGKDASDPVVLFQDEKAIRLEGKDFTYIVLVVEGSYFDTNSFYLDSGKYSFEPDKDDIISVLKYDCNLIKSEKIPVIFSYKEGNLYLYASKQRYDSLDKLEANNILMEDDFCVGFNPHYLLDAFESVDGDPICYGDTQRSGLSIVGEEYRFFVLPICINEDQISKVYNMIRKNRAA